MKCFWFRRRERSCKSRKSSVESQKSGIFFILITSKINWTFWYVCPFEITSTSFVGHIRFRVFAEQSKFAKSTSYERHLYWMCLDVLVWNRCMLVKALERQVLEFSTPHLMVWEVNQQLSKACVFIKLTGRKEEFQTVKGHVSIFLIFSFGFLLSYLCFVTSLLPNLASDSFITNVVYFSPKLKLFQVIMQDFQQCFNVVCTNRSHQLFFV